MANTRSEFFHNFTQSRIASLISTGFIIIAGKMKFSASLTIGISTWLCSDVTVSMVKGCVCAQRLPRDCLGSYNSENSKETGKERSCMRIRTNLFCLSFLLELLLLLLFSHICTTPTLPRVWFIRSRIIVYTIRYYVESEIYQRFSPVKTMALN